jgi:hypothetical protein
MATGWILALINLGQAYIEHNWIVPTTVNSVVIS